MPLDRMLLLLLLLLVGFQLEALLRHAFLLTSVLSRQQHLQLARLLPSVLGLVLSRQQHVHLARLLPSVLGLVLSQQQHLHLSRPLHSVLGLVLSQQQHLHLARLLPSVLSHLASSLCKPLPSVVHSVVQLKPLLVSEGSAVLLLLLVLSLEAARLEQVPRL